MASLQSVPTETEFREAPEAAPTRTFPLLHWVVGAVLAIAVGSWLVWLSASLQRTFIEEDVRAACQRIMPDTVQRCMDTVVIQRGGAKR